MVRVKCDVCVATQPSLGCFFDVRFLVGIIDAHSMELCTIYEVGRARFVVPLRLGESRGGGRSAARKRGGRENGGRGWGAIEFAVCLGARIRRRALS